jgi:tRNA dimethylallyltransferase
MKANKRETGGASLGRKRRRAPGRHDAGQYEAVAIVGPTGSGKSALALALAEALDGTIVNADSMQVYRELRVLTARPSPAEEALVPHRLYGVLPAAEACSAGRWRALAVAEIEAARVAGRMPILVGGTGLYLSALVEGLAPVPPVPADIRRAVTERLDAIGPEAFHAELARRDPASAALGVRDRQRLVRAAEVLEATGRPLSAWQARQKKPADAPRLRVFCLLPPRDALYRAIDARFQRMVDEGAVEEVRALLALGLSPTLPAMKAVGVVAIAEFLAGRTDLAAMIAAGQQASRRYAKRQYTWFRHRLPNGAKTLSAQFSADLPAKILAKLRPAR